MKVLSAFQADQERQARLAAQRTSQATEAAASAGQQYQTAAAAPPPQLDPLSASLPLLLGNISSIIGGDQRAPERAQMGIAEQRRSLMQARTDNLIALKDNFDKKARAAEAAGDNEAATKARMQIETLSKTLDVLHQQEQHTQATELEGKRQQGAQDLEKLRQKGDIELEQLRGRNARQTAAAKAQIDQADYFDTLTKTTRAGNKFLDLTNVPTPKDKKAAMQYAKDNGLTAVDKNESTQLKTAEEVYAGLDRVEGMLSSVLPHQTGHKVRDFLTRQARGATNAASRIAQSNSTPAAFASTMPLAIRSLQAVAAGPGSGFRLNQAEINMIQRRWPQLNDNIETAQAKLQWERWFLQNKEDSYFKRDWRPAPEPTVPGQPKTNLLSNPAKAIGPKRREDGKVYVRRKSDGRTGWISPSDPDFKLFEAVQ
jgi:hypothetical protein